MPGVEVEATASGAGVSGSVAEVGSGVGTASSSSEAGPAGEVRRRRRRRRKKGPKGADGPLATLPPGTAQPLAAAQPPAAVPKNNPERASGGPPRDTRPAGSSKAASNGNEANAGGKDRRRRGSARSDGNARPGSGARSDGNARPGSGARPDGNTRPGSGARPDGNARPSSNVRSSSSVPPSGVLPISVRAGASSTEQSLRLDTPLTREEAAELKRHLLFLRDYKKVLKLKVNAQEDLLLNGVREPSSRGVCHHLLQKVDYSLVSTAAARLDPKERPRLLAGVLGFKNELAFLLLYLECLKEAAHDDATLALEQALERIDFGAVSEGQMRRVLELIVELFDEAQRASLMLGLLESQSFRNAFDQALSKLPEALHAVVTPVRSLHAVVFKGKPNPLDSEALVRGLQWVLKNGLRGFERRPVAIRVRLIELLLTRLPEAIDQHSAAFQRLLESLDVNSRERRELEFAGIEQLLKRDLWQRAAKRLAVYMERYPADSAAQRLREALAAPRLGPLALLQSNPGRRNNALPSNAPAEAPSTVATKVAYLYPATLLLNQRPLWLRVAAEEERASIEHNADVQQGLLLPGVARVVLRGSHQATAYVALARLGEPLTAQHPLLRARRSALSLLSQVVAVASALADRGLALPDLNPRRFELLQGERLVLINLWELSELGSEASLRSALSESKRQAAVARFFSEEEAAELEAAPSLPALSDLLDKFAFAR